MTPDDWSRLCAQLTSLTDGVPYPVANMANAAALLGEVLTDINWVGFYTVQNDRLVLGPFCGKPACIEIPVGKGVCGTCVARNETVLVPDVHAFPGHIACDSASRSEIVIPLRRGGIPLAVLDIDSPSLNRFDESDRAGLEQVAAILEPAIRNL